MKVNTSIQFPQFLEEDRKDVKLWFKEFDRIAKHVAGGGEMAHDEYVSMLVQSGHKPEDAPGEEAAEAERQG